MAKGPFIAPPSTANKMVFRDANHNVILELEYFNDVPQISANGIVAQKRSECIEGVDGVLLTMGVLLAKPAIPLAVCARCRKPRRRWLRREKPSHGILLAKNAHTCERCHAQFCKRHSKQCSDGKWRCKRCAFWFAIKRFFTVIFFQERS